MNILTENYKLYSGDCLEIMDLLIEQGIKVDAIITDPPYGTTKCKWDVIIPFGDIWERLDKLIKPNGAIVLFGTEPFSSYLRISNIKNYRYDLIWQKEGATNFLFLKKQFGKCTENISIFYKKQPTYNPQMVKMDRKIISVGGNKSKTYDNQEFYKSDKIRDEKYPMNVLKFNRDRKKSFHPTQKPIALMEYLIKTYTNEGDVVLDFTMGSGSTGVACLNTNRKFIGIELEKEYFNIAIDRIFENYSN